MRAFHNKRVLKETCLNIVKAGGSISQDALYTFQSDGTGKVVIADFETELGIPTAVIRVQYRIWYHSPKERQRAFWIEFLESIHVGADLKASWRHYVLWLLNDVKQFTQKKFTENEMFRSAVEEVLELYQQPVNFLELSKVHSKFERRITCCPLVLKAADLN